MDGISLHLLSRLDAIRETQLAHGQILGRLAETAPRPGSTPPAIWRASWMSIAAGAGQWAGALLAIAYLARGGDAGRALELLHKLF
jgi:hypothetical protein